MKRLNFKECNNCKDWNGSMANCLNICGKPLDALKEFNELKELEEQGKLLKLPCAIGSIIYKPTDRGIISEYQQLQIGRWVSCGERLPDVEELGYGEFIVTIEGASESTTLTYYDTGTPGPKGWTDNQGNYYRVTAWMEFPEAYKKEVKNEKD